MNEPETRAKDIKRTIISPLNFHITMDSENLLQPPSSLPANLLPTFDYFTMEELESWDFGTGSSLHDVTVCMGQVLYEGELEYQHRHEHHDDSENRAPSSGPIRSQRRRGLRRAEAQNQYVAIASETNTDRFTGIIDPGDSQIDANNSAGNAKV